MNPYGKNGRKAARNLPIYSCNSRELTGFIILGAILISLLFSFTTHAGNPLPPAVSEIVRQLDEWRSLASGWLTEAEQAYTNRSELVQLRQHYITASAAANSLIGQLQLETVARTPLDPKRYEPTVKRAKDSTEALVTEGKRLLLANQPKTRGAPPAAPAGKPATTATTDSTQQIYDNAQKSIAVVDGLFTFFAKNKKAFQELDANQRKDMQKLLEERKWRPLQSNSAGSGSRPAAAGANLPKP